jgi:O-antigen ligase
MLTVEIEKRLTTVLAWGCLVVTLLVTDRISADPANVGKLVALATTAGCCLAILISVRGLLISNSRLVLQLLSGFLFVCLISIFTSQSPWEKGFFGTFGRNTGFLTYLAVTIIFLSATLLHRSESYIRVIRVLIVTGFANLIYCLFAMNGFDVFTWLNPYGKVLGTFGNPNFISSFLGIFITALFALFLSSSIKLFHRAIIIILILASLYTINASGSQQGGVVAAGGMAIGLFFFLRSRFMNSTITMIYSAVVTSSAVVSVLGMLQIGPLASLLYKQSVSLRGEYWQAGINMALNNPIFGVGLDSYGTFYRTFRNESATIIPGIDTISDAAHNIFIDIFASTGLLGFILYLAIVAYVLLESIRFIIKKPTFDPIFVVLFSSWLAYQAQSLISINQIGLVVWGWVLGGLLLGYTRRSKIEDGKFQIVEFSEFLKVKKLSNAKEVPASIALGTFVGGAVFLLAAAPNFYADAELRQATSSGSAEKLYLAAKQFPLDANRINYLASKISKDGINEQSVELVRMGVSKFPNDYGLLYSNFQISVPDSKEKIEFGKRLHEADPFNPAFFEFR